MGVHHVEQPGSPSTTEASSVHGSGRSVAANFGGLVGGDLLSRVFRFGSAIVLARSLTLEQFGVFNTTLAVAGVITVISTVGLTDLGTREIAVHPGRSASIVGRVLAIRLTALAGCLLVAVSLLLAADHVHVGLLVAGLAMALWMTLAADWILRGLEEMTRLGIAWSLGGATALGGSIVVAFTAKSATAALWAYAGAEAVIALIGWITLRGRVAPSLDYHGWAALLRRAWPLAITTLVTYAYTANLDTILLAAIRSAEEAGLYSAAYRIFWMLCAMTVFASYAALPALARRSAGGNDESVRRASLLLSRALICYAAGIAALALVAGGHALGLLFGREFNAMRGEFVVLSAAVAWYAIGFPAGQSLLASGQSRRFMAGAAVAGAANLGANLALIPPLGAMGAAIATTLSFAMGSLIWLVLRRTVRDGIRTLVFPALAITVGSAATTLNPSLALPIGLAMLALAGGLLASSWRPLRSVW